ncbi:MULTISPECIES: HAMP domain-containing sensor histidine kinase [Anaerococcus]|jgi:histidine kinase|uniref:histidine kinase n=1 Tax=Anaerococcus octavius TaxID=54007 RepID=A0A2I1M9V1_9FIRM|nr:MULTISPECIES: HAMP domain-containing sensor histidine kinase [Anaerococcus]MBS6105743.1 HAMP domain-containing histidine kinase [Anaerococcus sp.]MDU4025411.1 HAMP domain-containing sensor histidine kinase [Anaerococcus sp.]PKZ16910.1 two-component sensor histidine kinase [Anaerococcus octavius]
MEVERKNKLLKANNSYRQTIIRIIMLFVVTVVIGFEIFAYNSIRNYYESALIGSMQNQARISQLQFNTYMNRYDLSEIIIGDKNAFYRNNETQVQILDNSGVVLFDSQASNQVGTKLGKSDVNEAREGKQSTYKSRNELTNEEIISLSYPLNSNDNQAGILRLTSSMTKVNYKIRKDMYFYIIFGTIVSILAFFVSLIASRRVIAPILDLINVSEKLAAGDFKQKAEVKGKDELSELASTINFMSDSIVKREDMKNEFISSVSHELRTPLTSIKGWAITLQSKDIQQNADMLNQGLSIIESEGDRLSMMVEDLLDFSRLQSSNFKYDKDKIDIIELVKQVHTQLAPRATNEGIEFTFTSIYKSIMVYADKNRMKEVFINIIDNAIKFTSEGGKIDILIDQIDDNVSVTVKDNGEGIKEDEIAFVSSKFYKGSSSKSQTGLGLSICEEIIKGHYGKLIIKSKYGSGTSVIVEIPRLDDDKED